MGSVAVAAKNLGYDVAGSDAAVYAPMSTVLSTAGIRWFDGYSEQNLIDACPELIVIGNAISRGNPELEYVLNHRLPYTSMAAFVGEHFIGRSTSIVVSGTHGKTSTSTMIAWILECAGRNPGFLIGGVPRCFDMACRPSVHPSNSTEGIFVVEGDEYDTAFFDKRSKFVHYKPWHLIVNNVEFDHADIFDDLASILRSFATVTRMVPSQGVVLVNADDANALQAVQMASPRAAVQSVGFADDATWRIVEVHREASATEWTLRYNSEYYGRYRTTEAGIHSVRNASMAIASTASLGVDAQTQASALMSLQLPKRRLEEIGTWQQRIVVDDFAHHPTAIEVTIDAVRQRYPASRVCVVFEPRSNTSTRSIFQHEFERCFSGADAVAIGPINRPERYSVQERLNVDAVINAYSSQSISALAIPQPTEQGASWGAAAIPFLEAETQRGDVVLLLSNGNVGGLRELLVSTSASAE